jgi:hypothetical protein
VETIRGADFVLLVTEPTPFGLHDLKQVVEIARELGLPAGVVVNRDGIGDNAVDAYCAENESAHPDAYPDGATYWRGHRQWQAAGGSSARIPLCIPGITRSDHGRGQAYEAACRYSVAKAEPAKPALRQPLPISLLVDVSPA